MAFIEASYRLPSPSGVVMLLEMSTQNSMLVSTRLVRGALSCCGTGQEHDDRGQDQCRAPIRRVASTIAQPRLAGLPAVVERQGNPPSRTLPDPRQERAPERPSKASTAG